MRGVGQEDFPEKKKSVMNFSKKNIQDRLNSIECFVLYANKNTG